MDSSVISFEQIHTDFVTCRDVKLINWLEYSWEENSNFQSQIIHATINHPLSKKYPPPLKYRKKFIKALINKIEETKLEVNEELYNIYFILLNNFNNDEISYKTYYAEKFNLHIILEENNNFISDATTGLITWEASFYLADWCLMNQHLFHKKRVLELGCGIGFTGIVISTCCKPRAYCFTDVHEKVLEQLQRNIDINIKDNYMNNCKNRSENLITCLTSEFPFIEVMKLDWTDNSWVMKDYDVVLAADIVYDPEIIPHLVLTLNRLLENVPLAFIACTIRNVETTASFLTALDGSNISFEKNTDFVESIFNKFNSSFSIWKLHKSK